MISLFRSLKQWRARRKAAKHEKELAVERELVEMARIWKASDESVETFLINLELNQSQFKHISCKTWWNPFVWRSISGKLAATTTVYIFPIVVGVLAAVNNHLVPDGWIATRSTIVVLQCLTVVLQLVVFNRDAAAKNALYKLEIEESHSS